MKRREVSQGWLCPFCGEWSTEEASACEECGRDPRDAQAELLGGPLEPSPELEPPLWPLEPVPALWETASGKPLEEREPEPEIPDATPRGASHDQPDISYEADLGVTIYHNDEATRMLKRLYAERGWEW